MTTDLLITVSRKDADWLTPALVMLDNGSEGFRKIVIVADFGFYPKLPVLVNLPMELHHAPLIKPMFGVSYPNGFAVWAHDKVRESWKEYSDADQIAFVAQYAACPEFYTPECMADQTVWGVWTSLITNLPATRPTRADPQGSITPGPQNRRVHTIVIPYFVAKDGKRDDVKPFLKLARLLAGLTQTNGKYGVRYLLVARFDAPPQPELKKAFEATGVPVDLLQCKGQVVGHPAGCNAMFWETAAYMAKQPNDGGFWLWLESDMCPMRPDWLDLLDEEWNSNLAVVGFLQQASGVRRHINGGAMYNKRYTTFVTREKIPSSEKGNAWDWSTYPLIVNKTKASTRIAMRQGGQYAQKTLISKIPETLSIFHGVKDSSLINRVAAKYGISV